MINCLWTQDDYIEWAEESWLAVGPEYWTEREEYMWVWLPLFLAVATFGELG